jgi:hypothetical protein
MKRILIPLFLFSFISCCAQNIVCSSLKDRSGNLWFVVSGRGVYWYDGKTFKSLKDNTGQDLRSVNCIYEGKSGILWLGAEGGALQYNGRSLTQFPIPAPDSSEIAGNFALAQTPTFGLRRASTASGGTIPVPEIQEALTTHLLIFFKAKCCNVSRKMSRAIFLRDRGAVIACTGTMEKLFQSCRDSVTG